MIISNIKNNLLNGTRPDSSMYKLGYKKKIQIKYKSKFGVKVPL